MRRFILPVFALTGLAMALTACDGKEPSAAASQPPSAASAASSAPQSGGDDSKACATAKSARDTVLNDLIVASMTIADGESTSADVAEAATTLKTAFTKLADDMNTAAEQAQSDKLREALHAFADGAKTAVTNIEAAGSDASKLEGATEVAAMDDAEKVVLEICARRG